MIAAIHQPHYFPWLGYFDKMAKVDCFVLLDQVQFEKGSQMNRNRIIDTNGNIKYITISGETTDHLNTEYRNIRTKDNSIWIRNQYNAIENYYRKAPAKKEMMPLIEHFFESDYSTVCEWTIGSIELIKSLLEIKTIILKQSDIDYDRQCRKSDLVYALCKAIGSAVYFSGKGGSVDYLDYNMFSENGITIIFQDFQHPVYNQINTNSFIPGVSVLDMLFNCGIDMTRSVFWQNVSSSSEFKSCKR